MSDWSPPTIPRNWLLAATGLWLIWFVYTLIIMQQVLLGLFPAFLFAGLYVVWRFLAAFEAIADAQQRRAVAAERDDAETSTGRGRESDD